VLLSKVPAEFWLRAEVGYALVDLRAQTSSAIHHLLVDIDDFKDTPPVRTLQKDLTHAMHCAEWSALCDNTPNARDVRVLKNPTDAFLPFLASPTHPGLVIEHADFVAGLRFYLLLPQLLRMPSDPATLDTPASDSSSDFSYEADVCRHCSVGCDRHLVHAHACSKSSKTKITDRHELVKKARALMITKAGYANIQVEPRLDAARNQCRADIFYVEPARAGTKETHYHTDDTGGHPLSPTHFPKEVDDSMHTLHTLEKDKGLQYEPHMARLRNVAVVRSGLRAVVYRTCSFTSLGALGSGMSKCINGAAGFLKKRELLADVPRADGLSPQRVAGRFRFLARCCIQAAIMSGNAAIARSVGL
jgi:hypothetical protein